ncbi:hypothetical protein I6F26_30705, partial [Ensifer sp. IC3342]|nr:hypothetical protein [Ensifer sp. IC3342]
ATPLQRIVFRESALASRLESVRKLKAALVPLYQALDGAQKPMADRLLVPPMMDASPTDLPAQSPGVGCLQTPHFGCGGCQST